jgi:hypothetical protein
MKYRALTAACLSLLVLTNCAVMRAADPPPGPAYSQLQQTPPPIPGNMARIVFFRQHAYGGSMMQIIVTETNKPVGTNYDRSIFYADVAAGHREFMFTNPSLISIGSGHMPIDVVAGQTYYVELFVPGTTIALSGGGFANLPGGKPIDDKGNGETHCSLDICAHLVSAEAAAPVVGSLIFNGKSSS